MEALSKADLVGMLTYTYGQRWSHVPCFANYMPQQQVQGEMHAK